MKMCPTQPVDRLTRRRRAFSIVELLVVIGIIGLLLTLGVPAYNQIIKQSSLSGTTQQISGLLARASLLSVTDHNLIAVRACPAEWTLDPNDRVPEEMRGAQRMQVYAYQYELDPNALPNINAIAGKPNPFEGFVIKPNGPDLVLGANQWVAPVEALTAGPPEISYASALHPLNGAISRTANDLGNLFRTTSTGLDNIKFLDADDFLIVFDPDTGLRTWTSPTDPPPPLLGFSHDPADAGRFDRRAAMTRRNFTGVVVYPREPFVALPSDAETRQKWLRANGRPYYVSPFGGALVEGERTTQ